MCGCITTIMLIALVAGGLTVAGMETPIAVGLALGAGMIGAGVAAARSETDAVIVDAIEDTRARRYLRAERKLHVFERDGQQCIACGATDNLTIDHIIPISRGGSDDIDNLQTLCASCNVRKSNHTRMPTYVER